MVENPAVVEDADCSHQCGANQNAGYLRLRRPVKRKQDRDDHGRIHGQSPKHWNGGAMHLSRPGQIHHANAKSKGANRNDQHHGSKQCDEKSEQACGHATSFHLVSNFRPGWSVRRLSESMPGLVPAPKSSREMAAPRSSTTIPRF